MKENKYDSESFFQKYSQMMRSQKGLQGAGEWSELQKILPDFSGKTVLDLGCGYGWHCKYAADHKALSVLGTDISHKMIRTAQTINAAAQIDYQCVAMEDLHFPPNTFDVVLSSLAFHYIKDFEPLVKNISSWIKKAATSSFLWSTRCSLPTEHRTGIMMKAEKSCTSLWTTITTRGTERPYF